MSKDVKKKKSEETVQDEVKNQETDAKKEEACNCESECKADESQNTCEADESDKAEAQDESTESSKKKDPKDAVIEELQDRVKRQMAEFDNFRKRTEKEKSTMFEMGASDIIKKLLPIVDNFDRGFKSVTDEELETPFAKGMDMVHKQLLKMLEDADVKPIEALGGEFNPDFHNAVMHVEDDSVGENIVVEEFEKAAEGVGYIPFLYMDPAHRRQGLGVQLLGQAVSTYRPLGRDRLRLCCAPDNGIAQRFYQKYGFVKMGEEPGARGPLDVLEKYIGFEAKES